MLSYFSWNGRIGRLRYVAWCTGMLLVCVLISFMLLIIAGWFNFLYSLVSPSTDYQSTGSPIFTLFTLFTTLLGITIPISIFMYFVTIFNVQRLHDLNESGWWVLLTFIPGINILPFTCILCLPGSDDKNNYGAVPPKDSFDVYVFAFIALAIALIIILGYFLYILLLVLRASHYI